MATTQTHVPGHRGKGGPAGGNDAARAGARTGELTGDLAGEVNREVAGEPNGELAGRYLEVRRFTEGLTEGLAAEDMVVQSMPDVSPTKWHLAHTSWFFEQFVLMPHLPGYEPLHPAHLYLFNSYYHQAGERHCRDQRGYISRPTVAEVLDYRRHVDAAMLRLLEGRSHEHAAGDEVAALTTLGLNHEQQHQELLVTDIKHVFSVNPLRPVYRDAGAGPGTDAGAEATLTRADRAPAREPVPLEWVAFEGGVREIGHGGQGFAYDNETPRHREFLEPFELGSRLVTNGEYLAFMEDGGYQRSELWLSLGWEAVEENGWSEPFYWEQRDGRWMVFQVSGMRELDPAEPVCHVNYFEADAFARWAGARLPTEAEWEVAASLPVKGNFVETGRLHPAPAPRRDARDLRSADGLPSGPQQMFGDVWEWTASPYTPYPGYRPAEGAVGEYNGKFMCNQFVLRGGSCATSRSHVRPSYRNFFPPDASWQFTGLRLARDASG